MTLTVTDGTLNTTGTINVYVRNAEAEHAGLRGRASGGGLGGCGRGGGMEETEGVGKRGTGTGFRAWTTAVAVVIGEED